MIAKTILSQIKTLDPMAMFAWGAKELVNMGDGLKFKTSGMVRRKGYVYVHYNEGTDLYDVEFAKIRKAEWKRANMIEGVFVEDLVRVIDEQVG